jgi:S-adenosylmethionine synthetase
VFNGWTNYNPSITPGTWTKAGFTLTINLDCNNGHWRNVLTFTGTSSEAGPNSMTGTGNWLEYYYGSYTDTYTMTFTAVKTTNLQ